VQLAALRQLLCTDTLCLDLIHELLLKLLHILLACVLHRLLRSLDACTVFAVLVVGAADEVPPAEGGRVVVGERHVVEIVVLSARPERNNVVQRPGEVVATVCIDGLEETENDPCVHRDDVKVGGEVAVDEGSEDRASTKDEDLCRVCVLGGETEGCGVLVMDLVDVAVEGAVVERLVGNEVEEVLKEEEQEDLGSHGLEGGERNAVGGHAEGLSRRVEQPNLRGDEMKMQRETMKRRTNGSSIVK